MMDSGTKDTPITMKEKENKKILRVDEIFEEENWYRNVDIITKCELKNLEIAIK